MALEVLFNDIAAAIHEKDGETDGIMAEDFPARIRSIPDHPVTASPKDVNFYDYDGTLIYSYTLSEAQTLTALPKGPTHDGLVFQGWNWSLEDVNALTYPMNVSALYITDDGKTRLKIRVWDKAKSNVPLYFSQTAANGVTIDWGDGSSPETLDGTGNVNTSHQYGATGDYIIALSVKDGCTLGLGDNSSSYGVLGSVDDSKPIYGNLLQMAHIGRGVTGISRFAFINCYSLAAISIPDGVTNIGASAFRYCYSLDMVSIPDGVTSIGNYTFLNCSLKTIGIPNGITNVGIGSLQAANSLSSITIPNSVTSIGDLAFDLCRSLTSFIIQDKVASIGYSAFRNCTGMVEFHMKSATPPVLSNANAFEGIPPDCIIYVPSGSLEAYKAAENWSAYADYMREEPA